MKLARAMMIVVAALTVVGLVGVGQPQPGRAAGVFGPPEPLAIEARAAGDATQYRFMVELADTPALRAQGLMHRRDLAADRGMLFLFPRAEQRTMWMKNTYVPLDMLFIDGAGRIIDIATDTVPLSERVIASSGKARSVLELPAGTAARLGIGVGDLVRHPVYEMQAFPVR